MASTRPITPDPPSGGEPPPETAVLRDGTHVELRPLAHEVCRRYRAEFPDEQARYGDAGQVWCVHDNLHVLSWAIQDAQGDLDLVEQVAWLARVLEARDFPLARLARSLEISGDVLHEHLPGTPGASRAAATAATFVLSRGTFLGAPVPGGTGPRG